MCEVYEFPIKKVVPEELEESLNELAKEYVLLMKKALEMFEKGDPTDEEVNEFMEEVLYIYSQAIINAVDEV